MSTDQIAWIQHCKAPNATDLVRFLSASGPDPTGRLFIDRIHAEDRDSYRQFELLDLFPWLNEFRDEYSKTDFSAS